MPITLVPDADHREAYADPCAFAAAVNKTYDDICKINKGQLIGRYTLTMIPPSLTLDDVHIALNTVDFGPYDQLQHEMLPVYERRLWQIAKQHGLTVARD